MKADSKPLPTHSLPQVLHQRWKQYRRTFVNLRRSGLAEKEVHDFRVASRRIISLLRLLDDLEPIPSARKLERRMKTRFDALSRLRDVQVEILLTLPLRLEYRAAANFSESLARRENRLLRRVAASVHDNGLEREAQGIEKVLRAVPAFEEHLPGGTTLRSAVAAHLDSLRSAVSDRLAAADPEQPRTIHRLRIAFKKYRYALEVAAALFPESGTGELRHDAKRWQTAMGDINDWSVFRADLADFARRGRCDREGVARLADRAEERERETIAAFWRERDSLGDFLKASAGRFTVATQPGQVIAGPWTVAVAGERSTSKNAASKADKAATKQGGSRGQTSGGSSREPPMAEARGATLLYVMRHGIAHPRTDPDCPPDPKRALTAQGKARTRAVAHGLRVLKVRPAIILTSPYLRALQTAEIVAKVMGLKAGSIVETEALLPMADPAALYRELAQRGEREVLCAGHAPNVDALIAQALGTASPVTALKKAGVACLRLDALAPPAAEILWSVPGRVLRSLAG
jgi:phosphohistidine phosphatase